MAGATVLKKREGARAPSSHSISLCFVIILLGIPSVQSARTRMYTVEHNIHILVNTTYNIQLIKIGQHSTSIEVKVLVEYPDIVEITPLIIKIPAESYKPIFTLKSIYNLYARGISPGYSEVTFDVVPSGIVNMKYEFVRVTVMKSLIVKAMSNFMGWMYFSTWSFAYYLQIYINYKRKSVVGLNFDYLVLNITGFFLYSVFNCGLFYNRWIQAEYFLRFPRSHNPVHLNDVLFSTHAVFATLITITQCLRFERANQRVSTTARFILAAIGFILLVSIAMCLIEKISWLDFLSCCSYINLVTVFIKYLPQIVMNYRRKSTVGWSIGRIMLDFTGGIMSILQMVLNGWNYDDWNSFSGDVTKFGLGLFSLLVDILFMLQHYVLYSESRKPNLMVTPTSTTTTPQETLRKNESLPSIREPEYTRVADGGGGI